MSVFGETLVTNNLKAEIAIKPKSSGEINSSDDIDLIGHDSLH